MRVSTAKELTKKKAFSSKLRFKSFLFNFCLLTKHIGDDGGSDDGDDGNPDDGADGDEGKCSLNIELGSFLKLKYVIFFLNINKMRWIGADGDEGGKEI